MGKLINDFYRTTVKCTLTFVIGILMVMSMISTCYISSDSNEYTFFCGDNYILNLAVLAGFILIVIVFSTTDFYKSVKAKLEDNHAYKVLLKVLLLTIFLFGLFWIISTQYMPGSDQYGVLDSAHKISTGEVDMAQPGGYLERCPNQVGLAVVEYFFGRIVGDYNYLAFQLLNVIGLVIVYGKIATIMEAFGARRISIVITLALGLLFFPFIMYTSFVYGTIWHFALSLMAYDMISRYFLDHKWWRIFCGGGYIGLAIVIKSNASIMAVALLIIIALHMFEGKKFNYIVVIVAVCFCIVLLVWCAKAILQNKTKQPLDQGISNWAYVAMGLQEGESAPGWWNGYNGATYQESGYVTKLQEEVSKQEIKSRLAEFRTDKGYAFRFFLKKIASMWIEPTYESFWINQVRGHRVDFPSWLEMAMSVEGYTLTANIFNFFQLIVFLGVILWLALENNTKFNDRSVFILFFLGGFIFHIAWEAKSQYTITYFLCLLPYAVMGYNLLSSKVETYLTTRTAIISSFNKGTVVMLFVITIGFMIFYKSLGLGCLTGDSGTYSKYCEQWMAPDMENY